MSSQYRMAILPAAMLVTIYIAVVTHLSRRETERPERTFIGLALPLLLITTFPVFWISSEEDAPRIAFWFGLFCWILAIVRSTLIAAKLATKTPPALPPQVGALIRNLLPIQAALCCTGAIDRTGPIAAFTLFALWPVSRIVGKRFYAS